MLTPRPSAIGILALLLVSCAAIQTPARADPWVGEYFPLIMNATWTYQQQDPPYDTETESVFEYLIYEGHPAVRIGTGPNDHTIAFNTGHTLSIYAEMDDGEFFDFTNDIDLGVFTDGLMFEICTAYGCQTLLMRDWDAIDPALQAIYTIDPQFDDLLLVVSYEPEAAPNTHSGIMASNLPDGVVPPDRGVGLIDWYQRDVGLVVSRDIDADTGAFEDHYVLTQYVVGVADPLPPATATLGPNVPNPFNPTTVVPYTLARPSLVTVTVHDLAGRLLCTLVDGAFQTAGDHATTWTGVDRQGRPQASGTYCCRLQTASGQHAILMTLVR